MFRIMVGDEFQCISSGTMGRLGPPRLESEGLACMPGDGGGWAEGAELCPHDDEMIDEHQRTGHAQV